MPNQPYLSINLNTGPSGRRPTSAQLVDLIVSQIGVEQFPPGCRLPPVRVLAHQLGVSKNTVQRTYDELVARGLVESKRRVGLFLSSPQGNIHPLRQNQACSPAVIDLNSSSLYPRRNRLPGSSERIVLSGIEVADLREGENVLTDLWFGLQEKRIAAAEGVPIDEELRARVRRECVPPPEIDYRMST